MDTQTLHPRVQLGPQMCGLCSSYRSTPCSMFVINQNGTEDRWRKRGIPCLKNVSLPLVSANVVEFEEFKKVLSRGDKISLLEGENNDYKYTNNYTCYVEDKKNLPMAVWNEWLGVFCLVTGSLTCVQSSLPLSVTCSSFLSTCHEQGCDNRTHLVNPLVIGRSSTNLANQKLSQRGVGHFRQFPLEIVTFIFVSPIARRIHSKGKNRRSRGDRAWSDYLKQTGNK